MSEAPKVKTVVMGPIASQVYAASWRSKNNDPDGMQKACDDFIKTAELLRAELGITDTLQAKVARLEASLREFPHHKKLSDHIRERTKSLEETQ